MSRSDFISYIKESDARSDQNFERYRVDTQALKRLKSFEDKAFLAVGLKGIGKSAAFKSLSTDTGADLVQAISAETQESQEIAGSRPTLQYVQEIRAELVLQALISLVGKLKVNSVLASKVPGDVQQEAKALVDDFWGGFKNVFGGLGGVTILGFGISFRNTTKSKSANKFSAREQYEKSIALLERLCATVSVRIVVDDPEAIFASDERINENLMAALAIAAHELQKRLLNFKCVILIKPNILRALRRVDEFANLPTDARVRLSWSDAELKGMLRLRAEAARVKLDDIFRGDPEPALQIIADDSRSGPRDALKRLELHLERYPDVPVTASSLESTIDSYSESCFDQMYGAYERQYPGLCRASLILFEGRESSILKSKVRDRLDQMIASSNEVLEFRSESWARDPVIFTDLLIQFGLVAIKSSRGIILPFHSIYLDEAAKPDAVLTFIPGLRGRVARQPPA